MPILYADVIVDISSGEVDRIFQYRIPEELADIADIGMQILVPFGRGSRKIPGYIINISEQPSYDVTKIKEIDSCVKGELAIETQLIRLAAQIRRVYGATMIQALKTVLPVKRQIKTMTEQTYVLDMEVAKVQSLLADYQKDQRLRARVRLLTYLLEHGSIDRKTLVKELRISASTVDSLLKLGVLRVKSADVYRVPIRQVMQVKTPVSLNSQQQAAADAILEHLSGIHLLHGITGSGKTEVYMELIDHVVLMGRQVIFLIPEIALSYQTVSRLYARFGSRVSIMNSRLSEGERYDQFLRAKRGDIDIIVGPRSALFMPFERLGLIIIDEEHDGAYKSELTPKYHARDVAIWRGSMAQAGLVLGSATPSLESYSRALSGQYTLHQLTGRARQGSRLPDINVVDMRQEFKMSNKKIFSHLLQEKILERLRRHEQVILFLNRRGFAGFVSCRSCGHVFKCRHCDISMTIHRDGRLKCHYCGYEELMPKQCPACGSPYVAAFGTGTQKVESMVADQFPGARILRLDRDSTAKKDSLETILQSFRDHEADILVGTQMIVKGHDFPGVTLVGILAADLSMFSNDYMASERTFQLLTQAAGRAGRDELAGEVVIQTYNPEHYSIECAKQQDYQRFYQQEMQYRRLLHYPPVMHMMVVLVQAREEEAAWHCMERLKAVMQTGVQEKSITGAVFIGPANAGISRGKDQYRKILHIKHKKYQELIQLRLLAEEVICSQKIFKNTTVLFDVNPMNIY